MSRLLPAFLFCLLLVPAALGLQSISVLSVAEGNLSVGSVATIDLEIRPGRGAVYIESVPLTRLDTQISTRFAREYACDLARRDCTDLDFFYTIRSGSSIIGGPSAGAAMTVLTYASLEDLELREDTVMTGTVGSGGLVGPVGAIQEKVDAAEAAGFQRVLIPSLEATDNISSHIEVIPVAEIEDALYYFTGVDLRANVDVVEPPAEYVSQMALIAESLCVRSQQLEDWVENVSNSSQRDLARSSEAFAEQDYYSAASYCFSAALELRTRLLEEKSPGERRRYYRQLAEDLDALEEDFPSDVSTISDLEVYMIVRERLLDSRNRLEGLDYENISATDLAYAMERFNSAMAWSTFAGAIPSRSFDLSDAELARSCSAKLAEAEERINFLAYTIGVDLSETERTLQQAFSDQRAGEYALCVFRAAKAKAEADSVMTAVYSAPAMNESVDRKLAKARTLIQYRIDQESFPLLSYSYAEYAASLDDVYSANLYASYSLELASLDFYFTPNDSDTRFVDPFRVGLLFGGIVIGFIIGVLSYDLYLRLRKRPKKRRKKQH